MKWKMLLLFAIIMVSLFACKNKEKLVTDPINPAVDSVQIYHNQMAMVTDSLNAIINGTTGLSLEDQEKYLQSLTKRNIKDVNVLNLIIKAGEKIKEIKAAKEVKVKPLQTTLEDNFEKIMNAASYAEADAVIKETLEKFENPEAPVLIILYRQGEDVDYDKPTNIKDYLNYLKLQKKSNANIDQIFLNSNGKIKSLDLMHK